LAVFVDGAFWHGHPTKFKPGRSGQYWDDKIAGNIARDRAANEALAAAGWQVMRMWDFEVTRDAEAAAERVRRALQERGRGVMA
jgi:DNA mismatch endonuclease (patch repair protein)